jgi:hypothetical protein
LSLKLLGACAEEENMNAATKGNGTMDFETATPREVDEALAALNWEWDRKTNRTLSALNWEKRNLNSSLRFATTLTQMVGAHRQMVAALDAHRAEMAARDAATKPHRDAYDARLWNRYWIVDNVGGHVHQGFSCSTCFHTTEYNWLPALSGLSTGEMVGWMGDTACTVCYPEAPVMPGYGDGTSYVAKASAAEKAAKKAAKQAKAEAKKAATIEAGGKVYKTERTARIEITDAMVNAAWDYHQFKTPEARAHVYRIAQAIAEKTGSDAATVLAEQAKKANAKIRKTNRDAGQAKKARLSIERAEITIDEWPAV